MKKIFLNICIAVAFVSGYSSCKKLNQAPEDYFGSSNFWKNTSQVDGAMLGLHSGLRGFQSSLYTIGELRGGMLNTGTGATGTSSLAAQSIIIQDIRESSPGVGSWLGLYGNIFQVNNFIYNVSKASFMSEAEKNYYLGQAYGIRAYYYFVLYKTYGRLPIMTEPVTLLNPPTEVQKAYVPRTKTQKETLDFIKSDIKVSEENFGTNELIKATKSQWSLYATLMLKAEVYLWSAKVNIDGQVPTTTAADLVIAREALEKVIPKFSLVPNYTDIFTYANKGNSEVIFALRFIQGESSNFYNQFVYAQTDAISTYQDIAGKPLVPNRFQSDVTKVGDPLIIAASGSIIRYEYNYDKAFMQYEIEKDARARASFFDYYKGTTKNIMLVKFMGTVVNNIRSFSDDFPIYRLSEALLMLAEVKNKQGESPADEINRIRQRAYGANIYPVYVNGTFEQNELAILAERKKEFVAEGKIWFDLIRMQDASGSPLVFRKDLGVGVLDKATEAHKLLWPIDRGTLNQDPTIEQNTGYTGT